MENVPHYIDWLFGFTAIITILIFFRASQYSRKVMFVIIVWMILQTALAIKGFFTETKTLPPRLAFLIVPPIILIMILLLTKSGQKFLNSFDIGSLTLIHTVRVPVEIVLYLLFLHKAIPRIMTFEGHNVDILAGLTALIIYYFGCMKGKGNSKLLLTWNVIAMLSLINIVVTAVLSAPYSFQQFGFEQPNVAILYFPFSWLPGIVVPLILLSHIISIRKLILGRNTI